MTRHFESEFKEADEHVGEAQRVWDQALPFLRKGWRIKTPLTVEQLDAGYRVFMAISDTEGHLPAKASLR